MRHGFEWDDDKAEQNARNHDVSFDEATGAFYDPSRVELFDEGHSEDEARYVVLGFSDKGRLLFVSFPTWFEPRLRFTPVDKDTTRIIHARVAERKWRKLYEENS